MYGVIVIPFLAPDETVPLNRKSGARLLGLADKSDPLFDCIPETLAVPVRRLEATHDGLAAFIGRAMMVGVVVVRIAVRELRQREHRRREIRPFLLADSREVAGHEVGMQLHALHATIRTDKTIR